MSCAIHHQFGLTLFSELGFQIPALKRLFDSIQPLVDGSKFFRQADVLWIVYEEHTQTLFDIRQRFGDITQKCSDDEDNSCKDQAGQKDEQYPVNALSCKKAHVRGVFYDLNNPSSAAAVPVKK